MLLIRCSLDSFYPIYNEGVKQSSGHSMEEEVITHAQGKQLCATWCVQRDDCKSSTWFNSISTCKYYNNQPITYEIDADATSFTTVFGKIGLQFHYNKSLYVFSFQKYSSFMILMLGVKRGVNLAGWGKYPCSDMDAIPFYIIPPLLLKNIEFCQHATYVKSSKLYIFVS